MHELILGGRFLPVTNSVGLLECPVDSACSAFVEWLTTALSEYGQGIRALPLSAGLRDAFGRLLPLTSPVPVRYLILRSSERWTAFFDNGRRGTDPAGIVAVLSTRMKVRGLRITLSPDTESPGRESYEARILEFYDRARPPARSIACADDGGSWVFEERGAPLPFEDPSTYSERRVRKRFSAATLATYCTHFGVDLLSENFLTDRGVTSGFFVEKNGNLPQLTPHTPTDFGNEFSG